MRKQVFNLFLGITVSVAALAQPQDQQQSYTLSLQQCIDFALQNQITYQNSKYDVLASKAKIGEVRAAGLPQASIAAQLLVTNQVQKQFVQTDKLGSLSPQAAFAPSNSITPLGFAVPYYSAYTLNVTQMIFDGSFLIGLQAAKVLTQLSTKNLEQSELQIIENVSKAFYLVQINKERGKVYDINIARIDSTLKITKAQFQKGFVEGIDVSRLQVSLNNLLVEKQKFDLINELGIATLKFQIGMPQETNLSLSGSINDVKADTFNVKAVDNDFNYNKRIEYRLLETQKKLQEYDVKNIGFGYAPRLSAFGNLGGNAATTEIASWHTSANFFNFGLTLNVPVFDGLNKAYRIQQSKINLVKADNNIKNIKNTIDFQLIQSENTLRNSIKSLSIQKNNLDLSNEVAQVTRRKYEKGVGSNLELITAESALKEALINYYSALYDVIVSKVDFDKATGNLK